MSDRDDDWMIPWNRQSVGHSTNYAKELRLKRPFLIQREKVIMCTWVGDGPPRQWDLWASFETKEERDAALAKLRQDHPAWHLRARHLDSLGRIVEPPQIDW
jgi:hypothetical protein